MTKNIMSRKAPLVRLILVAGAFLVFMPHSQALYNYNENCRNAYEAILSLRFSEAEKLIRIEKKTVPENLVPVYLENFIDFLVLIIGEERAEYDQLKRKKAGRVSILEKDRDDSPLSCFCLGEVHLQWALARLKFGDYATAAIEIHKAHDLFTENKQRHPSFLVNKMGLGVIQVMASLIPDNYKWIGSLIGLQGSMSLGMSEIRQVAEYSGNDEITKMYKPQASFFLVFLTLNLQKNKKDALTLLPLFNMETARNQQLKSPLMIFARATVLMKNGQNDEALAVLRERFTVSNTFPFPYLDYLEGIARLNRLDDSASFYFEHFLAGFHGRNYIRSAGQKLAWIAILRGDTVSYNHLISQLPVKGAAIVDEDKQAGYEALRKSLPNVILLRARLLFDGGYYNLAINELLNTSLKITVKSKGDLVEYNYRLGRIYHETGNYTKAIENYQQAIQRGKTEPYYFAASAALQLGLLYENTGAYQKADNAYHVCLSIDTPEYKTSLHQKAKAGLSRLKMLQPKT